MIWIAAVPFVIAGLLAMSASRLAGAMQPSTAVRLLTGLALSVALCTGLVLSAVAVLICIQWGPLPRMGGWSVNTLKARMEFPTDAGIAALVIVAALLAAALVRTFQAVRTLTTASRSVNALEPSAGDVVLIEDDIPTAYSVAGIHGRIVISTSMLAALSAPERRVLIAHEESHLRHRHNLYLQVAEIAAAANPLLRPVVGPIRCSVERWADEDAAIAVSDRQLAARALTRAAIAASGSRVLRSSLAIADGQMVDRVQSLMGPAPTRKLLPIMVVTLGAFLSWATTIAVSEWANNLVQLAESVYGRR